MRAVGQTPEENTDDYGNQMNGGNRISKYLPQAISEPILEPIQ